MFRFSIRDVLWLTVVVAFAVLWWGEYRQRMSGSSEVENLKLREQNLLYQKLVETYKAELEEIQKAIGKGKDRSLWQ